MPVAKCAVCNQKHKIKQKDWKYLDQDGPYVCSSECLTGWIGGCNYFSLHQDLPENSWVVNGAYTRPTVTSLSQCNFRSRFESDMAVFFLAHRLDFHYEYITFLWGGKEYTPDFYFPEYGCFVEAKGLWQNSNRSKYRDFRATFPMVSMVIGHWLLNREFPKKEKPIGGIV